jgi:hypothetical protein
MDGLVIETPRLTAVFRSFLTESGKSYDYQNEYIHARKEAINARSKKYCLSFLFWLIYSGRRENNEKINKKTF